MSMVTSNRLLPLLAGSVVFMAALVAVKSCSPDEEQAQVLEAVPVSPEAYGPIQSLSVPSPQSNR